MRFDEVLGALAAGKKVRRATWLAPARFGYGYAPLSFDEVLATDWEIVEEPTSDGHHPRCARVPGYCGVKCDVRKVAETMAATIARLERELRDLRAGVNTDRATLLRDLEDTRRVRDQRWSDAKEAKAEQYRLKSEVERLERALGEAKESLDFCRAGNRTLTEAAAATARELGEAKRKYGACGISCGDGATCTKPRGHKGVCCMGDPCMCGT